MSDKELLELNDTQLLWANEYLSNGMKKTAASRVAYPDADCPAQIGSENYRKPHIFKYIQERAMELIQGKGELTSKLINKWCEIAFYENEGLPEDAKYKPNDILKASELLGKYLALFVEKHELDITTQVILTTQDAGLL
jgi:hypothetical protein